MSFPHNGYKYIDNNKLIEDIFIALLSICVLSKIWSFLFFYVNLFFSYLQDIVPLDLLRKEGNIIKVFILYLLLALFLLYSYLIAV